MKDTKVINKTNLIEMTGDAVIETAKLVTKINDESEADLKKVDENLNIEMANLKALSKEAKTQEDKKDIADRMERNNKRKIEVYKKKENARTVRGVFGGILAATPVLLGAIFYFIKK